jgi:hypothetical protein
MLSSSLDSMRQYEDHARSDLTSRTSLCDGITRTLDKGTHEPTPVVRVVDEASQHLRIPEVAVQLREVSWPITVVPA